MSLSNYRAAATRSSRGFTLIETLIATGIMLTGLVAVASIFAYSTRTNMLTQQRSTATLLATSKMEDFRGVDSINTLTTGGSIVPATKVNNYFEYVSLSTSGAIVTSTSDTTFPYLRLWEIGGTNPVQISVSVYAQRGGITDNPIELIRTSTNLTNGF